MENSFRTIKAIGMKICTIISLISICWNFIYRKRRTHSYREQVPAPQILYPIVRCCGFVLQPYATRNREPSHHALRMIALLYGNSPYTLHDLEVYQDVVKAKGRPLHCCILRCIVRSLRKIPYNHENLPKLAGNTKKIDFEWSLNIIR